MIRARTWPHAVMACSVAAAAVLAMAVSVPARAGTYILNACSPQTGSGAWTQTDTDPGGLAAGNMCGGSQFGPLGTGIDQGALVGEDNLGGGDIPPGVEAGWTFTAPAGTTVAGVSYYRSLDIVDDRDFVVGMFLAAGTALESCQGTEANHFTCSVPNNQAPARFAGLDASGLFFGIMCQPVDGDPGCLAGATEHDAQADVYSAAVTLFESAAPTVGATHGALWGGGVLSGTASVSFNASDPSGILQASLTSDQGQSLTVSRQTCDYTQATPCPQLTGAQLSVDTSALPDGAHTVVLTAQDAASNTASATSPTFIVDNDGPPAVTGLAATAVGAGSDAIDLTWTNPTSSPQPIAGASAQLCQATCAPATALPTSGSGQLTAPGPGSYTVRLWLTDTAGKGGTANVASTSVTVPPPTTPPPPPPPPPPAKHLRLSHRRRGDRLTVTVHVPSGVKGRVRVSLDAFRHGKQFAFSARFVKVDHALARTVFVLSKRVLHAARLVVHASANGASSAQATLHPSR